MKLKSVNIFGKHVPIVRTVNLAVDHNVLGQFHRDKFFIEIDNSLTGDELMLTQIHECIHALIQRAGLYQTGLSHELEEIIAEQVSIMLVENFTLKPKRRK
jgi:hypothetical protein